LDTLSFVCASLDLPLPVIRAISNWSAVMTKGHDLAEDRDVAWEADPRDGPAGIHGALPARAPVYYRLPDTPEGHHIKEYASGLRQLVRFVGVEEQIVKFNLG